MPLHEPCCRGAVPSRTSSGDQQTLSSYPTFVPCSGGATRATARGAETGDVSNETAPMSPITATAIPEVHSAPREIRHDGIEPPSSSQRAGCAGLAVVSGRERSDADWKCPGCSLHTQPRSPSSDLAGETCGSCSRPNCMVPGHSACVQGLRSPLADAICASDEPRVRGRAEPLAYPDSTAPSSLPAATRPCTDWPPSMVAGTTLRVCAVLYRRHR